MTNEKKTAEKRWIISIKDTSAGMIPIISSIFDINDVIGGIKVRWGYGRMNYDIKPGLYGIGDPDAGSPVFVTANYKLTFDKLRRDLEGINGWILVLDTKGVNVWCAAGKGTFGTAELIKRIYLSKIDLVVNHRNLILPQLGAVGVSAHQIRDKTGFKVIYGPVRSADIRSFIKNNFTKTNEMKRVDFNLRERLVVSPIEFIISLKFILLFLFISGILSIIASREITNKIILDFLPFLFAFLTGIFLFPVLLPIIPGRSFALKGYILGIVLTSLIIIFFTNTITANISSFLILPVITSYLALNFTGASTFTSLNGTKLEVKIALPVYITMLSLGTAVKIFSVVKSFFS
jgi:hypothetical protein